MAVGGDCTGASATFVNKRRILMTDPQAAGIDPQSAQAPSPPLRAPAAPSLAWALPVLLVVGGLAGAAGSEMIKRTNELFQVAPERLGIPPRPPEIEREMFLYSTANHAIGFGLFGLLTCGALGLVLGAVQGPARTAIRALLVSGILGLLLGAAGGAAAFMINEALVWVTLDGLFKAMLIHLPNWLLLTTVMAITATAALHHRPPATHLMLSVVSASAVATVLYPLVALFLYTTANSDRAVPFEVGLRILCFALGGAILGLAAARWLRSSSLHRA
jgi:hypothetical protein